MESLVPESIREWVAKQNSYELYDLLLEIEKVREDIHHHSNCGYSKMVRTGKLDFYDYGRGYLNFSIYYYPPRKRSDPHQVRVFLSTIDDGDMGAWVNMRSQVDCFSLIETFVAEFLSELDEFPTLEELNRQIGPKYNIWIYPE